MLIDLLRGAYTINDAVIVSIIMVFALILHNVVQAYVASRFGDNSARYQGFLSFEPQNHLEPIGVVFLLLLGFGWPKEIVVNGRNYRKSQHEALVWYAGPLSYFAVALSVIIIGAVFAALGGAAGLNVLRSFVLAASVATLHGVINLFPVFPLDGAKAALAIGNRQVRGFIQQLAGYGFIGFFVFFFILNALGVIPALIRFFLNIFLLIAQAVMGLF